MRLLPFVPVSLLCASLLLANAALAALPSAKKATQEGPEAACNPARAAGDLTLPMPGGLSMTFRAVAIPGKNPLYDKKFSLGLSQADGERGMYERQVESSITAPFAAADLPADWRRVLGNVQGNFYYFMGKYEISNAQWQAVMGGDIPQGESGAMPRANISWYDIQQFLQKYNSWLLANHAAQLPFIEESPAFLRLPSEEEWEFAARGGNLPPEKLNFDDFPLEDGKSVEDYAVFGEKFTQPKPIGGKLPNPLGLHDMGGNVAELTDTHFRFTIADSGSNGTVRRLHGSQGGFVSKGGSFLASSESEIYPGKRVETRMFVRRQENGKDVYVPFASRSVGARLVLTCLNVPGARRAQELFRDYQSMGGKEAQSTPASTAGNDGKAAQTAGKDQRVTLDHKAPLVQELDKVIAAAASPFMKSNLYQLRDMVEDSNAALARERDANLGNAVRTAIYKAASLNDMAFRCRDIHDKVLKVREGLKASQNQKLKAQSDALMEEARSYFTMFDVYTKYYKLALKDLTEQAPLAAIEEKIGQIRGEYAGKDRLSAQMTKNLDVLGKHLQLVRKQGLDKLDNKRIWQDVLAQRLYQKVLEIEKMRP